MSGIKCHDHLGNEYPTIKAMCEAYNLDMHTFRSRIKLGWNLEKALITPVNSYKYIGKDGQKYNNAADYFNSLGLELSDRIIKRKLKSGITLDEIMIYEKERKDRKRVVDHLGNEFNSQVDMCNFYDMKTDVFRYRIRSGWSLSDALTTPIRKKGGIYYDHLGNKFSSLTAMCSFYNVDRSIYLRRIELGWSKQDALTSSKEVIKDGYNNVFNSYKELCEYYNINYNLLYYYKNKGKSIKEIIDLYNENNKLIDPFGNVFRSMREMANHYGVCYCTLIHKKTNTSFAARLGISISINPHSIKINKTKYNLTVVKRIKKGVDVFECYIDNEDGSSTFRIMSLEMIDQYCIEKYKELHPDYLIKPSERRY